MNPKIEELALEAMGTRKYVPPVWQFYDSELEKFAQLIVQKCITTVALYGVVNWENDDISWVTAEVIKELKEKFEL